MLFKIGSVDVTKHVQQDGYSCNAVEDSTEWVDGSRKKHKIVHNEKIKGSVKVICGAETITVSALNTALKNALTTDGNKISVTCYIANKGIEKAISVFFTTEAEHMPSYDLVTISFEEA